MQASVLQCRLEAFPELPEQKGDRSGPGPGNGFDPEWVTLSNFTVIIHIIHYTSL